MYVRKLHELREEGDDLGLRIRVPSSDSYSLQPEWNTVLRALGR